MNNQEIIDNAPKREDFYFVDITGEYFDEFGNHLNTKGLWSDSDTSPVSPRSLADIKRIVELESVLKEFRPRNEDGDGWDFVYDEGSEYLGEAVLKALKEDI